MDYNKILKENFNVFAEEGQDLDPRGIQRMNEIIKLYKKIDKKIDSILDVGCACGSLTFNLAKISNAKFTSIDISNNAISYAKSLVVEKNLLERIKFIHTNLLRFKQNKKFDLILCSEVLEHIKNDDKAVKILYTLLKTDGFLILTVPLASGLWSFLDERWGHYRRYKTKDLVRLLKKNKFKIIECYTLGFPIERIFEKLYQFLSKKETFKVSKKNKFYIKILLPLFSNMAKLDLLFKNYPKGNRIYLLARK